MVFTVPVAPRRCSRRRLLTAGAGAVTAGLLAGCGRWGGDDRRPTTDPLDEFLRSTHALAQRYASTLAAFPDLAERLGPLHATHVAHVAALRETVGRDPTPSATPSGGVWTAPVGAEAEAAVAALRQAEEDAQREAADACLAAPPNRAVLLGTIAAARATHVKVLT